MAKQPASAESVTKLVQSIMGSRRYEGFQLTKVEFANFSSVFALTMSWEGKTVEAKIPSELIDEVLSGGGTFSKRKLKRMLKDALGVNHDGDE